LKGYSNPTASSENNDIMSSNDVFTKIDKEMKCEKDYLFKLMNNVYSSLIEMKKLAKENEKFRSILAELNDQVGQDKFSDEVSRNINKLLGEFINYEEKIEETEIDSESEIININEVKESDHDEFLYFTIKNKEIQDVSKNNILKKTCLNCGSKKLKKGKNTCYKCSRIKKTKDKCDCNEPYCAKGMCRKCYDQMHRRNLPIPKMCIKCNSKRALKGRKTCWSCSRTRNKKKPFNCNCDKPHYCKGLCRSCYARMNKTRRMK
jgi:hypothetical protein